MANKFYITTPIYYVNDIPHLGHAYTSIAADVLARYYRAKGRDVFFLTGTDEHGAKIAEAAEKSGKTPQEFVDTLAPKFKELLTKLNISNNQFIRTTNKDHERIVQDVVKRLQKAGYIEKRKYQGWYCVGCEKYLLPGELVEGKCPDHKKEPVLQSEENYFFLLSKAAFDFKLEEKIKKNIIKIAPEARKNELLGKIKAGLEDVSISRENVTWGVRFPGDDSQTIYVWIDALINYYTATKIYQDGPKWPANLHLVGKDILWFHGIIWPCLLMAIGEEPPREVFAHGYFKIDGQKMSKSIGNVIDPIKITEKYGTDVLRYALLTEFPFGEDGDISEEKIEKKYNQLASGLGNQVSRVISMINKYNIKVSPSAKIYLDIIDFDKNMNEKRFDLALASIEFLASEKIDKFIEETKPWELYKRGELNKLTAVLSGLCDRLKGISELIEPFMPETAEKMKKQLKSLKPEPLFPKLK